MDAAQNKAKAKDEGGMSAAEKEAKRLAKERKRKRKALEDAAARTQKELDLLEKYRQKYNEQKSRSSGK